MRTDKRIKVRKLELDPALSPGVLDTGTWDRAGAWSAMLDVDEGYWKALAGAAENGEPPPATPGLALHAHSFALDEGALYWLAKLADGQQVFVALRAGDGERLGERIGTLRTQAGELAIYPTDAAVIDRYTRLVLPGSGPVALGSAPRLGIGTRMTTSVWPAIWEATEETGCLANAIQNSVRELNFLETLLEARPAEKNIAFGFGTIETGYTGSSFEGLWVAGVLNALEHGARRYGADADHIQVKRGAGGLERAQRLLDATRYYSFYTMDVSDVLDYGAQAAGPAAGMTYLEERIGSAAVQKDFLAYHRHARRVGEFDYRPDDAMLGRLAGKYWAAMDAVGTLYEHLCRLKNGVPFDLELSIDEHPNEIPTFECLTSETELAFVLLEAERRGLPLTHVAPNFGVEKGTDYRGEDGLPGFEARARRLWHVAESFGVMIDFHSGDDLSAETRRAIRRATAGANHFKVSPYLQLLFGEVLSEHHPDLFSRWWEDALAYARREAEAGSRFAMACIEEAEPDARRRPVDRAHDAIFHHFSFAYPGRRGPDGRFICREEFYSLSPAFYRAYHERLAAYLVGLAEDLFGV